MASLILRRFLHAAILIAVTLTVTFVVLDLAPGDPLARYLDPGVDPADVERMRRALGFDDPLPVRYVRWGARFVAGDFGESLSRHRPVHDVIADALPRTLVLTGLALAVQIVLGVWIGVTAARHRHRFADRVLSTLTLVLYAIPPFYLGYLLMTWLALDRAWLPTSGLSTPGLDASGAALLADRVRHLVMPTLVLGVASAAAFARFARGSLADTLGEDWVRTARAKGLPEGRVVWRHAFRNALPPLITITGLSVPFLIGGAVIVETVFAWPGLGSLMVESIRARDYPVVLAINFVGAVLVIAGNLGADLAMLRADPRARRAVAGATEDP